MTVEELRKRIQAVEEGYEFFLAFAAQGVRNDRESPSGGQLRDALERMAGALRGMGEGLGQLVEAGMLEPADAGHRLAGVLGRDADAALAAIELVLARPGISSQLIDNLNASIHVRALLTDLFLIDELLG